MGSNLSKPVRPIGAQEPAALRRNRGRKIIAKLFGPEETKTDEEVLAALRSNTCGHQHEANQGVADKSPTLPSIPELAEEVVSAVERIAERNAAYEMEEAAQEKKGGEEEDDGDDERSVDLNSAMSIPINTSQTVLAQDRNLKSKGKGRAFEPALPDLALLMKKDKSLPKLPSLDLSAGSDCHSTGMASQNRHPYSNQGYLPNGAAPHPGPVPGATPLLPNQGRILETGSIRVLCIADVRGNLKSLNELAKQARANYIIHTGDFGFYDDSSLERIADKTLKHVAQYSPLIAEPTKKAIQQGGAGPVKSRFQPHELPLSELSHLLTGELKLDVPVYTVWGACEDVRVLEKFRSKEYKVPNLYIIDEAQSMLLEVGGVKLRLLGLGGAVVMHKLFDNGEGRTTIAGGQGTMWTTLLQMGELVDTANRVYDPTETRVFVTHASPAREGILNQLSVTLKADFSVSAGLHFRYGSSYNEFSVNPTLDHYRGKLAASKASFNDVWETVKGEVEPAIQQNEAQQNLLKNALGIVEKMPTTAAGGNPFGGNVSGTALGQVDESAFKNMWNFNLADAAFGWLVLEVQDGRIGTEMRAQGFNFSHRGAKQTAGPPQAATAVSAGPSPAPSGGPQPPQPAVVPPPQRQQTQPPQPKPTGSTPGPQQVKPATPAPSASPAPREDKSVANGNAKGPDSASRPGHKNAGENTIGLFVMNVQTDEQVRELFAPEDKDKIVDILRWGQNKVAEFKTIEDRDGALERLPEDVKSRAHGQEDRSKPLVKVYLPPAPRTFSQRGGAGNWGSSRGARETGNTPSGYRSQGGGTASDSEGAGRRGGRGGRGRGGERGGRGGRRGGNKEGGGSPAQAPAAPADS